MSPLANYSIPYQILGQYSFTTAGDQTGLNPGNLTSVLDTSSIKMSKFEMYRLVLGISTAQLGTFIVQSARAQVTDTSTVVNVSFPSPTTLGNTIVVLIACGSNSAPTVTSVTIGGAADNFGAISGAAGAAGSFNTFIWVDPNSATSSPQVTVTMNPGAGSMEGVSVYAYEVNGLLKTNTASSVTDVSATGSTAGATSVITSAVSTTNTSELAIGIALAATNTLTLSLNATPSTGWTQALQFQNSGNAFAPFTAISGYDVIPAANATVQYGASWSGSQQALASVAVFFPSASNLPGQVPFTVALDSQIWDVNQTVSGVGYSYDPHVPMYINQGQRIAVLWTSLPTAQYKSIASKLMVTAWFRFDPSIPANNFYAQY